LTGELETVRARFCRDRWIALCALLERLRHDLSTPLSGAALHAEIALRRADGTGAAADEDLAAAIRTIRREIDRACELVEGLDRLALDEHARPAYFPLSDALEAGLGWDPGTRSEGTLFGFEAELTGALAEISASAAALAEAPSWSVDSDGAHAVLTCRLAGALSRPTADELRAFERASRLGPARFALEAGGGTLRFEPDAGKIEITLKLAASEEGP
jgi:hypothetical protein